MLLRQPLRFARGYWLGLSVLLLGAMLDAFTTWVNVRRFGPDVEAHPAMWVSLKVLGVHAGLWLGTLAKIGFALFVSAVLGRWCQAILILSGLLAAIAALSNHYHWL